MMVVDVPAALRFRFCLWFSSGNTSHILSSDDSLCVSPFRLTLGLSTFASSDSRCAAHTCALRIHFTTASTYTPSLGSWRCVISLMLLSFSLCDVS